MTLSLNRQRTLLMACGLAGLLAVGLGAMGGHALKSILTLDQLATWETATRYLVWHVLAALLLTLAHPRFWLWPASILLAGGLIFGGSLYLWLLTDIRWLTFLTPLGGFTMLGGWLTLIVKSIQYEP